MLFDGTASLDTITNSLVTDYVSYLCYIYAIYAIFQATIIYL
jgi:hypothetical protein